MQRNLAGNGRESPAPSPQTAGANHNTETLSPSSPNPAVSYPVPREEEGTASSTQSNSQNSRSQPRIPITRSVSFEDNESLREVRLELQDGTVHEGYSFGAPKSAAGELVFQTGMVGYPESITDPSYRGQLLIITFPLVGNYGVPSRQVMDEVLKDLPKYFESNTIHIAGLIVASYCGEDYSHYLAESSLGKWLKENDVPGIFGVDTRDLTTRIRETGSMLGRMILQPDKNTHLVPNGDHTAMSPLGLGMHHAEHSSIIDWKDPNTVNLVREGRSSNLVTLFDTPSSLTGCSVNYQTSDFFTPC